MPADRLSCRAGAFLIAVGVAAAALASTARAEPVPWEVFGNFELEGTLFPREPRYLGQQHHGFAIAGQFSIVAELSELDASFVLTPFLRADSADTRRTHTDLREAKLEAYSGPWSFVVGSDVVFWGKTEFTRLVDIVNQVDQVENHGGQERLGQPMLRASYLGEIGEFSVYYMPYFRERVYPGRHGRLRFHPPVDTGRPHYAVSQAEWTPSFAVRFEGVFGDTDLGVSAFSGLARDPALRPVLVPESPFPVSFQPYYERIFQAGIDAQHTVGATLWKVEAILRNGQRNGLRFEEEDYAALAGGLEYALHGIGGSSADLGLIAEYAWDSRGDRSLTGFQDDLFLGARLTLNDARDTALLIALATDMENDSSSLRLEAEARLADRVTVSVAGQTFWQFDSFEPGGGRTDDDLFRVKLNLFF